LFLDTNHDIKKDEIKNETVEIDDNSEPDWEGFVATDYEVNDPWIIYLT